MSLRLLSLLNLLPTHRKLHIKVSYVVDDFKL